MRWRRGARSFAASGLALAVGLACGSEPVAPGPTALPVVPGMEGFGTHTVAGRGGVVMRVTTLADTGPGSLRAALAAQGPRVVIFEVAGTIRLDDRLEIEEPFVTVAGQTAPSPGVTLRGAPLRIDTHDVLIQHLRVRPGDDPSVIPPEGRDGLQVYGDDVYNVVVDHVSVSWGVDENLSTGIVGNRRDFTIRHSIIAEGLSHSVHPEGEHSKAVLVGEGTGRVAIIGCLLAHNRDRNPYVKGNTAVLFVNNVVYNWGSEGASLFSSRGDSRPQVGTLVGNVYAPGQDTPPGLPIKLGGDLLVGSRFFVADNVFEQHGAPDDPWGLVENDAGAELQAPAPPIWTTPLAVRPAREVEAWLASTVGARPADRDAVDRRVVASVLSRTGRIIDSPDDVGGWPILEERVRPLTLPDDPTGDADGDGYTNLEEWLHELAAHVEGR